MWIMGKRTARRGIYEIGVTMQSIPLWITKWFGGFLTDENILAVGEYLLKLVLDRAVNGNQFQRDNIKQLADGFLERAQKMIAEA